MSHIGDYIAINAANVGAIIDALTAQLTTMKYQLEAKTEACATLAGELATVRSDKDKLQAEIDEISKNYPEVQIA